MLTFYANFAIDFYYDIVYIWYQISRNYIPVKQRILLLGLIFL